MHTKKLALLLLAASLWASCGKDQPTVVACFEVENDTIAPGQTVEFGNCSMFAESYEWNFGDGHGSDAHSPAHQFAQEGAYTVTLSVYGNDHVADRVTSRIVVRKEELK